MRQHIKRFTDIPNVGPAVARHLATLGPVKPRQLADKDPYELYRELCTATGKRHDPCVIDVFIAAVGYMRGDPARKWWEYTAERKQRLQGRPPAARL